MLIWMWMLKDVDMYVDLDVERCGYVCGCIC